MTLRIVRVIGTSLFAGTEESPLQIVDVVVAGGSGLLTAIIDGHPSAPSRAASAETRLRVLVPHLAAREGTKVKREVRVESETEAVVEEREVVVGHPGWTIHVAPHFHYDPVWWNTQAGFLTEWERLPSAVAVREFDGQLDAFALMERYLAEAESDLDFVFVLAEIDYLKPWWDSFPDQRHRLSDLIRAGRVELAGGCTTNRAQRSCRRSSWPGVSSMGSSTRPV